MAKKLEIERKFLVKFPESWEALSEMFDDLVDVKRISQTYLSAKKDEQSGRVRKTIQGLTGDTDVVYHYNKKKPVTKGVHEESEHEISKKEYHKLLEDADPSKVEVQKNRFVFRFNDQDFELDVFKGALKGLAILEIELESKTETVELPPFLRVIKEVTDDKRYNNFNLARKALHEMLKKIQ